MAEEQVNPSEFWLVQKARQGDHEAFRMLYESNVGKVYALCRRMSYGKEDASEMTQDVFVRAWEKLHLFRGESRFSTWLHRLAVNVVLAARRSTKRRIARVFGVADLSDFQHGHSGEGSDPDLEKAIASLPERARMVFVLHDVEGFNHEEIADEMGLATGTTKAQLHRARKLLRERLDK